jgi:hypothetical protein
VGQGTRCWCSQYLGRGGVGTVGFATFRYHGGAEVMGLRFCPD